MRKSVTTKFAFASIYIFFTVLLIIGVSVKQGECQEDPCEDLARVAECPCDYNVVPKDLACWGDCKTCTGPPVFHHCMTEDCDDSMDSCALYRINLINGSVNDLSVYSKPLGRTHFFQLCHVRFESTKDCPTKANYVRQLTFEQAETCLCRLEEYATELNLNLNGQVSVMGGPPFECQP